MLKRLGFWNRLALVAIIVFGFGAGTWLTLSANHEMTKSRIAGYELCLERAFDPKSDGSLTGATCAETWLDSKSYLYGWNDWLLAVLAGLAAGVFVYLVLWIVIATGKWIWRGRVAGKAPSPVGATPLGNETD